MLTSVGGELWIDNNDMLQDLSPLENILSIGENPFTDGNIFIVNNDALTSLEGLGNIAPASILDLNIYNNPQLSECNVSSLCDYLVDPAGTVDIHDNASGCDSQGEIELACWSSAEEIAYGNDFIISPNPCSGAVQLSFVIRDIDPALSGVVCDFYDVSGVKVKSIANEIKVPGIYKKTVDLSDLKPGVYFCRLKANNPLSRSFGIGHTKKIIKLD